MTQAAALFLIVRLLGSAKYGSYVAPAALAIVLSILPPLGAGLIMMARAPTNEDAVADVWSYAWPLSILLGGALISVYVPIAIFIAGKGHLPILILFLIGFTELIATPLIGTLSQALQASHLVPLSQFVQWIPLGLRGLGAFPCFLFSEADRLLALSGSQLIATLLGLALSIAIVARHVNLTRRPRLMNKIELADGITYAVKHMIAVNSSEIDKMLSVRLLGNHEAGIYAAGARILSASVTPVIAMLLTAQPRLFHHAAKPDGKDRKFLVYLAFLALTWGILVCLGLNLLAPALALLLGPDFFPLVDLMPWFASIAVPLSLRLTASAVLIAFGRPRILVLFELFGILLLAFAIFAFTPAWGIRGLTSAVFAGELGMGIFGWAMVSQTLKSNASRKSAN